MNFILLYLRVGKNYICKERPGTALISTLRIVLSSDIIYKKFFNNISFLLSILSILTDWLSNDFSIASNTLPKNYINSSRTLLHGRLYSRRARAFLRFTIFTSIRVFRDSIKTWTNKIYSIIRWWISCTRWDNNHNSNLSKELSLIKILAERISQQ